jgi:hypothetical protein
MIDLLRREEESDTFLLAQQTDEMIYEHPKDRGYPTA